MDFSDGAPGDCLPEDLVFGFVQDQLAPADADAVKRHMDRCAECRRLISETARAFAIHLPPAAASPRAVAVHALAETHAEAHAADADGPAEPHGLAELAVAAEDDTPPAGLAETLGRYVVLRPIGAGGMGIVYEAYDPKLERKVALKLLHAARGPSGNSESKRALQDRLLREAQAMARLSHPNVVTVHDTGTLAGQVFIAMEFVAGQTLSAWLKEQPRPWPEVLRVFLQAGAGLSAAHAAGVIHRDFKPDNVLMAHDGRVRVTDFGLARPGPTSSASAVPLPPALRRLPALNVSLTRSGLFLGTPAYMAPEQLIGPAGGQAPGSAERSGGPCIGSAERSGAPCIDSAKRSGAPSIDARADQFSFCVALYEGLYGERPFPATTLDGLRQALSQATPREPRDSHVPARLRRALLRGLSRDPAGRYPSMDALLGELERSARPRWPRALAITGIVVILGLCLLVLAEGRRQLSRCRDGERKLAGIWDKERKRAIQRAFLATGMPYARDAWTAAEQALDRYTGQWVAQNTAVCEAARAQQSDELLGLQLQCLGQRLAEVRALSDLWAQADPQVVERAPASSQALDDLGVCESAAALRTWLRPPAEPAARKRVDELRAELVQAQALELGGKLPQALASARAAAAAAQRVDYLPVEAEALCLVGEVQTELGDYKAAEAVLVDAVSAAQASQHDEVAARAWIDLMYSVGYKLARYEHGLRWNRYAAATLQRLSGPGQRRLETRRLEALGSIQWSLGRDEDALSNLRQAISIAERGEVQDQLTLARSLEALAFVYSDRGKLGEALALEQRALSVREGRLGSQHPDLALNLNNLGYVLWLMERHAEALPYLLRSLSIYEAIGARTGAAHPEAAVVLDTLGRVQASLGQHDLALQYLQRAAALLSSTTGPEHPDVARVLVGLGQVYRRTGRPEQALQQHRRALAVFEGALGPAHSEVGMALYEIGEDLLQRGQAGPAREALERAQGIVEKAGGKDAAGLQRIRAALLRARGP